MNPKPTLQEETPSQPLKKKLDQPELTFEPDVNQHVANTIRIRDPSSKMLQVPPPRPENGDQNQKETDTNAAHIHTKGVLQLWDVMGDPQVTMFFQDV